LLQEELGYIEGGSATLVKALAAAIESQGGSIRLSAPVKQVFCEGGRVQGVRAGETDFRVDNVISTVPIPFVNTMVPDLSAEWKRRYAAIPNIGVVCVVFKLRRSVTPHFWVNIADASLEIPGIIEFSNLRPTGDAIVYMPYYMPPSNPKWKWTDEAFVTESFAALRRINPDLSDTDRIGVHVGRLRYAQPVCAPGFASVIPPVQTSIEGLQIADTCFYYPEDRGIAESVKLGKAMAEAIR
jgi:protoporphyrinogen oxidase